MPSELADFLDKNQTWVGVAIGVLVTVIVGVIGIAFSRSRQSPRLVYQARAIPLISNELRQQLPKDTSVLYKGRPVERLTKLHLAVWNAGGATLEANSVVEQLRWVFEGGGQILEVTKIRGTSPGNDVVLSPTSNPSRIHLDFNYLDPGDGALYEVLHTSPHLIPNAALGWIKGVQNGFEFWGTLSPRFHMTRRDLLSWSSVVIAAFLAVFLFVALTNQLNILGVSGSAVLVVVMVLLLGLPWYFTTAPLLLARFGIAKRPPVDLIPAAEAWDYAVARNRRPSP